MVELAVARDRFGIARTTEVGTTSHNKSTWLPTWSCYWALPGKQPLNAAREVAIRTACDQHAPALLANGHACYKFVVHNARLIEAAIQDMKT